MELNFQYTDCCEILYLSSFWKCGEKIKVLLKSDKNNGNFTWRSMYICDNISPSSCRMRNVSDEIRRKSHNTYFIFISALHVTWCRLWATVEKYGRARQITDGNVIWRMRFACLITKATYTHWDYVILLLSHGKNGYANIPQCYFIRTLSIFFTVVPCIILITRTLAS
jgi:hypothetical protein